MNNNNYDSFGLRFNIDEKIKQPDPNKIIFKNKTNNKSFTREVRIK